MTSSCVDELNDQLGGLMTPDGNYHYQLEWENGDGGTKSFEFTQENDPFQEEEDETSLSWAVWDGENILDATFIQTFKKVRQKVFRWLEDKFDINKDDLQTRRAMPLGRMIAPRQTEIKIDEEIDVSFDEFIKEINVQFGEGTFDPVVVKFDKAKPTEATTTTTSTTTTTTTSTRVPTSKFGTEKFDLYFWYASHLSHFSGQILMTFVFVGCLARFAFFPANFLSAPQCLQTSKQLNLFREKRTLQFCYINYYLDDLWECRSGWTKLDGSNSCFLIRTQKKGLTWHKARSDCIKKSSHLVRIDSDAANNHVIIFIRLLLILNNKLFNTPLINEIRCTGESRIQQ